MKHTIGDGFPFYIELLGEKDFRQQFASREYLAVLEAINEEQSKYRYAPGKWSIKQIIGHVTDHERIMTYRALRFSRKDVTLLPGYDQDLFVDNAGFDDLSWQQVLTDFKNVRSATNSFINNLSQAQLACKGIAWKYELTVEEFLRATAGHEMHHMQIIKDRYLKQA